jgi:ribonuclease HI
MIDRTKSVAVVHADESCLGNGREGRNPGGAASLIEIQIGGRIHRLDLYISSPDTTNNRMALSGAIATFAILVEEYGHMSVIFVSDSQYLIKGMSEWVRGWRVRGWRRKGGPIENLNLWKKLVAVTDGFDVVWQWVRGHAGHAKNEYANDLAMKAAREQVFSEGAEESLFHEWLERKRSRGQFAEYDPDQHLIELEASALTR